MAEAQAVYASRRAPIPIGAVVFRGLTYAALLLLVGLIAGVLLSVIFYLDWQTFVQALFSEEVLFALKLTLITTTATTAIAVVLGAPAAYALSRYRIPAGLVVDTVIDLPIVLPPLMAGVALLVLFQTNVGDFIQAHIIDPVFTVPGIILAQFFPTAGFAVRAMKGAFDSVDPRMEQVARTLGCSEAKAFWWVVLPLARNGMFAGAIMTWARCVGIFGPIVMFCGATRMKTEVLPVAVFLNMSIGKVETALAIAVVMLILAVVTLVVFKKLGGRGYLW